MTVIYKYERLSSGPTSESPFAAFDIPENHQIQIYDYYYHNIIMIDLLISSSRVITTRTLFRQ